MASTYRWRPVRKDLLQSTLGETKGIRLQHQVPYVEVKTGSLMAPRPGWFLLDTGSTLSTVERSFLPEIKDATLYYPPLFDFFDMWNHSSLTVHDYSHKRLGIEQAGIIGTDFLSKNIYTIDYQNSVLSRCYFGNALSPDLLNEAGLEAMDTSGYYSTSNENRKSIGLYLAPNVPTVPIRLGGLTFAAQIDSGYNDWKYPYAININILLKLALDQAGIKLIPVPELNSVISTCVVGVSDQVTAFKLPPGVSFSFLNLGGQDINHYEDVHIFLKTTPDAALVCGGISSWNIPAAQVGASFLKDAGFVIFDPKDSKVWIPKSEIR